MTAVKTHSRFTTSRAIIFSFDSKSPKKMFSDALLERLDLFVNPLALCALIQFAGTSAGDSSSAYGLPVGHATKTVNRFIDAIMDRLALIPRVFSSRGGFNKIGDETREPFPSKDDWRPVLLHAFLHRDLSHFLQNAFLYAQSIAIMQFPSALPSRNSRSVVAIPLGRGIFLAMLLSSGALLCALSMDFASRQDRRKVQQNYSLTNAIGSDGGSGAGGGIDFIGSLFGMGHDAVRSRTLMIGASGSIFSLVGYNAGFSPRPETILPAAVLVFNDVLLELTRPKGELFSVSDVAHCGHIGGFIWGLSLGLLLRQLEQSRWQRSWNNDDASSGNRSLASPWRQWLNPTAWYSRFTHRAATATTATATTAQQPGVSAAGPDAATRDQLAAAAAARQQQRQ